MNCRPFHMLKFHSIVFRVFAYLLSYYVHLKILQVCSSPNAGCDARAVALDMVN